VDWPLFERESLARDALEVARDLLGGVLRRGGVWLRITEVEAYRHLGDSANHCRMGRTPRNAPMWGRAGHSYVYLCYGVHHLLNVVTDAEGQGAAVLVRAAEPLRGHATIRRRRGGLKGPQSLAGPGKVGAALGIDTRFSGHDLLSAGGLELRRGPVVESVISGPRVGIAYADPADIVAPWRLADASSAWVSHRRDLS